MVQVPIRGLFFLGRTAVIIAAAAAVPYIIKKNKRLGDQIGDALIKAGKNLKKGAPSPTPGAPKTAETVKSAPKASAATASEKASAKPKPRAKSKSSKGRTAKKTPPTQTSAEA